jgi:site-specific DNA-methyltransferase (adenine-specific)
MNRYKTDLLDLRCMDCMELLRDTPDKAYDLAIVDPPYGIGNWVQTTGNVRGDAVTWNDSPPMDDYFTELIRVSKHRIIWGANYYGLKDGRCGAIVWNKHVPRESNMSVCEIASYDRLARVDCVDLPWRNINRCEITIHPCQKPVALYKWLLHNYAKPGDKILDTHLGSMSIAIACHYAGYHLTGCELDEDYFKAGVERVKRETAQRDMFTEGLI